VGVAALAAVIVALSTGIAVALHQARIAEDRFQQVRTLSHRFIFDFNDQVRQLPGSTAVREMMVGTALEYLDHLSENARGDRGLQWELAKAYEKVGDVQGSPIEPSLGHTAAALKSYEKAIALQERLASEGFLDASQRESLAHCYAQVAAAYRVTSSGAVAVKAAERGLFYAKTVSESATVGALTHLALAQTVAGEPARALETNRAAE
jgi:hypothetical protein